jgi:hypothetical protein
MNEDARGRVARQRALRHRMAGTGTVVAIDALRRLRTAVERLPLATDSNPLAPAVYRGGVMAAIGELLSQLEAGEAVRT